MQTKCCWLYGIEVQPAAVGSKEGHGFDPGHSFVGFEM